jgi:hypothetical protein
VRKKQIHVGVVRIGATLVGCHSRNRRFDRNRYRIRCVGRVPGRTVSVLSADGAVPSIRSRYGLGTFGLQTIPIIPKTHPPPAARRRRTTRQASPKMRFPLQPIPILPEIHLRLRRDASETRQIFPKVV